MVPNLYLMPKKNPKFLMNISVVKIKIDDGSASLPREIIYFQNDVSLSNVRTTESEVVDLLKSVDIGKGCGPDGIGNRILKLCADGISSSLSNLTNLSLSEGKFPDAWKLANVTTNF